VGQADERRRVEYLLTGLSRCALCGGGLYVTSRHHGRQRAYFYACTSFHRKGHTVCANNRHMVMEDADWKVMEAVQDELLDPAVIRQALREASDAIIATPETAAARLEALSDRGRDIAVVLARLTAAVASRRGSAVAVGGAEESGTTTTAAA
jgi:hypothetical protein